VLGLGVCVYTGILLGSLRARAFWNTPILPVLFLVSGLSTGAAGQSLVVGAWPYRGSAVDVEAVHAALRSLDLTLVVFEIMVLFLYVLMMRLAAGKVAARIAATWLAGQKSLAFWGVLSSSVWRRRGCSTCSLPRRLTQQHRSSCSSGAGPALPGRLFR